MTLVDEQVRRTPARPAPVRRPSRLAAAAAVAVPTGLVAVHALAYGRWIVDDAAITFAYARSVATGDGPVLQPGAEVVEGYSNPAWLALLVLGRWLGVFDHGAWFGVPDYVAFPKLLALVCCAGVFACCYAVAKVTTSRPALVTIVAGAVTAAVPSFVIWTMSGLENALLALAAAGIAAVLARAVVLGRLTEPRPAVLCGLLAALAALTRPDGLVYLFAFPVAALLLMHGRPGRTMAAIGASLAAFAVPFGAYLAWRIATFGELLPNTALAKNQGIPQPRDLARPAELMGHVGWLTAVLALLLVGAALARPWPGRDGLIATLVPLGLAVGAYTVLKQDWMGVHRFATPVWVLGALAATIAAAAVLPRLLARGRIAVALVAAAGTTFSALWMVEVADTFRTTPTAPMCLVAQNAGHTMDGYAELIGVAEPTVLAPDIGAAALVSSARIVDMAGLADGPIARYWHDEDFAGLRDHVFTEVRPTFIKSHETWSSTTGIPADPRMATDYARIGSVSGTTDWVRRDALRGPEDLRRLREYHVTTAGPADTAARLAPRGSCGDVLRPGREP